MAATLESPQLATFRNIAKGIDKYLFLRDLQLKDEPEFYRLLLTHSQELLPFVYTPTVGEACQRYSHLPFKTRGLYLTAKDAGNMLAKIRAWPKKDIKVIVITDGERILGLGDLGAGGMGISEGKILLYTVVAGVAPDQCLPVCLDVGTNNQALLEDPQYIGLRQGRVRGAEYDALVAEVFHSLQACFPHTLVQFEDFANANAFRLLDTWRVKHCSFNDDIQGTACITLAGLLAALRITGRELREQRVLFLGAGEAGTGIAELVALALHLRAGLSLEEARRTCYFMDSKGLVCQARRADLQHHKLPFAHDVPHVRTLEEAVRALRPTALIGVSTMAGAFTKEVVTLMSEMNHRPIIFPLSNPTAMSECTYQQAYDWSDGRVVFASGSPFPTLTTYQQTGPPTMFPAQANNAYVFPSVGYAAVLSRATSITDELFLVAAESLAAMSSPEQLRCGRLFPPFDEIREVAVRLTSECAQFICSRGLGTTPPGVTCWKTFVKSQMFQADDAAPTASRSLFRARM